ncbi:multidrug efflux RND transporter permease subunit [Algivirga pacifica]|uniref:Efflux RND transporter permease subunit n=1 Tax=Algivirga pacifica TaxID=1162670 RepID=A0ABP9DC26_9BACT
MFETFIKRPVLSTVISIFIVIGGVLSMIQLPVSQFPDIAPPSVSVQATYTGANAVVCANSVAAPLEDAINGVEGMTYMNTVCNNSGITNIQVFFELGTDPDIAAVNVQNRVATAMSQLPSEVVETGVETKKRQNSILLFLTILSDDSTHDEKFLYNYMDLNIIPEIKRINGIGDANIFGGKDYSIRVWLKPEKMIAYNLSTTEVTNAIKSQNLEAAPGRLGESSFRNPQVLEYILKYKGKLKTPEEYENIIVKTNDDGSLLYLKDIAEIELGTLQYSMISKTNGKPACSVMLYQTPGSNAQEIIANVKAKLEELKGSSFPQGVRYELPYDISLFLDASIHEVVKTLVEAFILVFIVVFIFLQDFRSTLIPAIAVPVSLVGAFIFLVAFGFSINLLTLFALVLAIGIVVDDAIVVVEAVHTKMHEEHMPPVQATFAAMKEIVSPVIATTLVVMSVFVPSAFLSGPTGVFYRQFALTIAMSVFVSSINALTLSPALCALLLKPPKEGKKKGLLGGFFNKFNELFDKVLGKYAQTLRFLLSKKILPLGLLTTFIVGIVLIAPTIPTGFIPTEDQGVIFVDVTGPPGASLERSQNVLDELEDIASEFEQVENVTMVSGYSILAGSAGSSYGFAIIQLKPWEEREGKENSVFGFIQQLNTKIRHIKDANIIPFAPPTVPGFGTSSGFEMRLQDRTGGDLSELDEVTKSFSLALSQRPEIAYAMSSFSTKFPQYEVRIDEAQAMKLGVTVQDALVTLQTYIGSYYASNFTRFGKLYRVMIQSLPEYRKEPSDLLDFHVKNDKGEMVPLSAFAKLQKAYGPEQVTRFNVYSAALINGQAAPGFSTGDAINAIYEEAESLPRGFGFDWSGMTREEVLSSGQAGIIFAISFLFVFLVLAAQYESYITPISLLLSIPTGVFGVFVFLKLTGLENNIYAQVALIMLIGLLAKNAVLIVEFALIKRREGMSILESAIAAATLRLRPILMTSFAFVLGVVPLAIATGAGAIGNRTIGISAFGGMLFGTIFGVIIVPALYVVFQYLAEKISGKPTPPETSGDTAQNEQ